MDTFVLGILLGIVLFWMLLRRAAHGAGPAKTPVIKTLVPVPVRVELINGIFYVWSVHQNEFLAQGSTAEQLLDHLEKNMTAIHVHVVEGEPDVIKQLKAILASTKLDQAT